MWPGEHQDRVEPGDADHLGAFLLAHRGSRPAPLERTCLGHGRVHVAPLELEQMMPTVTPLF